jgi:hypothetical protein
LDSPENLAAPPEGQELLKTFCRGEFRTWQGYHPGWSEWLGWRGQTHGAFTGEKTVEEAVDDANQLGDRALAGSLDLLNERIAKWGKTD